MKLSTLLEAPSGTITSNILGLCLIDTPHLDTLFLKTGPQKEAFKIVAKYVGQGLQGLVKAQRELIEADLDDYAEK